MLSQTAEHALRALLFLARQADTGPVAAEVVAEAIGAPRNYLSKTLNALAKRGIVTGTRGPHGGFHLAVDPSALTVARVLRAFDSPAGPQRCLLGGRPCSERTACAAHAAWKTMWRQSLAPLERTTLADLLGTNAPWGAHGSTTRSPIHTRPWRTL